MIFWDLDGPILDVRVRYYSVYRDIFFENNAIPLPQNDFWDLKRSKVASKDIISKSNFIFPPEIFNKLWVKRIEMPKYLTLDTLQPSIVDVLGNCKKKNKLVIVTLRRSRKMLLKQLEKLKIIQYFEDILNSGTDINPRWDVKYNLIKKYIGQDESNNHMLIGDTETDIKAGKKLSFKTIAISDGIRNEKILLKSNPDLIYSSVLEFHNNYVLEKFL